MDLGSILSHHCYTGKNLKQTIKTWQQELAEGFNNVYELYDYLHLSPSNNLLSTLPDFPVRIPREFADRMEKGNINDPLLKQVLPVEDENISSAEFTSDPVGDLNAMSETGVIHKYQGRVLLITTGSCAINCRYCFRRNFPYADFQLGSKKLSQALHYIENNSEITEVILSGGDPLLLNDEKLFSLLNKLNQIKSVKRIRIHSRIPVVLPSRITDIFCSKLNSINKPIILVIHSNHENELNKQVKIACRKLTNCNITLLNQSVLLKDINDSSQQLCQLNEKLFEFGVIPYYLHLLDKATGTSHFEVDQKSAIILMDKIKKRLPGYLVPKLVKELAGASNKIIIA